MFQPNVECGLDMIKYTVEEYYRQFGINKNSLHLRPHAEADVEWRKTVKHKL